MNMQVEPRSDAGCYVESEVATIGQLALNQFDLYVTQGVSLQPEDYELLIIEDMRLFLGWTSTNRQRNRIGLPLNRDYPIYVGEWATLAPLVKAHVQLAQARRVDALAALGGEHFGLTVSEAEMNYQNAVEVMKKEAFVEPPFNFFPE